MLHCLLDCHPLVRVEDKGSLKEVLGLGGELFEDLAEPLLLLRAERVDVSDGSLVCDEVVVFLVCGGADYLEDLVQLVLAGVGELVQRFVNLFSLLRGREGVASLSWEDRGSLHVAGSVLVDHIEELGEDASHTPYIDFRVVIFL